MTELGWGGLLSAHPENREWSQHTVQLYLVAPTVLCCCSRLEVSLDTPGAPGVIKSTESRVTSPQTSKNDPNAPYRPRSQEDSDCPFSNLFILELLMRLQEEHSALLSQHSAVSVVGGVSWASGLSGDNDGWGSVDTLWACVKRIRSGVTPLP